MIGYVKNTYGYEKSTWEGYVDTIDKEKQKINK
jgi:hypothetical protein